MSILLINTGKTHIEYGAVFMSSLPRRRRKDGKPYGLTRHRLYTVLRLFLTDLKDGLRRDIRSICRLCTYFPPLHTVVNAVFRQSTVVLAVFEHGRSTKVTVFDANSPRSRY